MKPNEFWNSTYRQINIYTQSNLSHIMDEFKQEIRLQEAVTNKLIMADAMSNRKPKIISLQKTFESLFLENNEKERQSTDEITRRMRAVIQSEKGKWK